MRHLIESTFTLYKLIILYMLQKVNFPLTNAQISDYILDRGYTNYFHLQQAISEMLDTHLVEVETIRNTSYYQMTEEGRHTLEFFVKEISSEIRDDIDQYLKDNSYEMRNEVSTIADYYKNTRQEYEVRCQVREQNSSLIDLTLTVPSEKAAKTICNNWKTKSQAVYSFLMKTLAE